jgi:hypothetical protein
MSTIPFCHAAVSTFVLDKAKTNAGGKGKSAWINTSGPKNLVTCPASRVLWPIRPSNEDYKPNDALNFEFGFGCPQELQISKEIDDSLIKQIYDNRVDIFGPSKAKAFTCKEALIPSIKTMTKPGSTKEDGSSYDDTLRAKVYGWTSYIKEVNMTEFKRKNGDKLTLIKDCVFRDRLDAPAENDTHFYLYVGDNPETGKPKYTDKVLVMEDGSPVQTGEKDGKPTYQTRFVGPQDVLPGYTCTVVFNISKVYISDSNTGPILVAKEVYVKPAPKKQAKTEKGIPSVEIVESVDMEEMKAATESIVPAEEAVEAPAEEDTVSEAGSKKRSKKEGAAPSKKRKTELPPVAEDF